MTSVIHYAHSLEGRPVADWHPLAAHLERAAELAAEFAAAFDSSAWARLAGLWHDLGKYQPEFQEKLQGHTRHVDHAIVGALLARRKDIRQGLPLAFVIAGHHTGLANWLSSDEPITPLKERLRDRKQLLPAVLPSIPHDIGELDLPPLPEHLAAEQNLPATDSRALRRRTEFWIRFLYSALVDADFLDTEDFYAPGLREGVTTGYDTTTVLRDRIDSHVDELSAGAEATTVNRARAEVLQACRMAAESPPGVFSLTVPTGGGKTLSAMAFALRHAALNDLQRVIAVIPYTSIIEQNAQVYRDALGAKNVIEHHSNIDPKEETERNRLASENWDAPVIVTTSVQLFESLFSNRPSRCRKLHNIARSVIVLDEVQTLPSGFLLPILEGLQELVAHYGTTVVLSTATQPALLKRESLPQGFTKVREIIPVPAVLTQRLHRVELKWPESERAAVEWPELAAELAGHEQVLAVVHRRRDARELAELLPEESCFHLSALMCPKHRSEVLGKVQQKLADGEPCRLVSTQLVEAGVDIDFPVVYRALGPLDSVAQAAGRCNREGLLEKGQVVVFRAPTSPPSGTPAKGLETTEAMLQEHRGVLDISDPAVFETYFRSLYFKLEKDSRNIQRERQSLNFATVAASFKLIEDGYSDPVVVPYNGAAERIEACRAEVTRDSLRALQPFLVNVYHGDLQRLEKAGALELIAGAVRSLAPPFEHLYDRKYGLVVERLSYPDSDRLIT